MHVKTIDWIRKGEYYEKKFWSTTVSFPQPVMIIGTYDAHGKANAMNAAWGGIVGRDEIMIDEEIVRRNPFNFNLTDVVVNDSRKRISMTEKQQKTWMDFIRSDKVYSRYHDEFVVLLGTGILFVLFHFFPYLFDGIEMLGVVLQGEVKGLADAGGLYSFHGLLSVSYLINQPMFR